MNPARDPAPRQRGFTLLELLVVLAVLGLALAVTAPRFAAGLPAVATRSAAQQLAAGLQLARNTAVTANRRVEVVLRTAPPMLVVDGARRELPATVELALGTEDADGRPAAERVLRFFPDGSASGASLTVARERHRYRVELDWLTGAVRVASLGPGDA